VDNPSASGGFTPMRLVKQGPGSLVDLGFDGTNGFDNTYTGGTVINNGRIPISSSNALGTGPVTIRDGGQVAFFNSVGTRGNFLSNNFTIAGTGGGENNGPFGAIRLGVASQTFSVISGNIALAASARVHNQNTNDGILAGVISGPATATLTKTGGNVVLLSNPANTYLGATETGARDQTASGAINVMRLANGGVPSSLGASSNAASNVLLQANGILRYVGPGDSTDRLFTLGSSFGLNAIPTTTIETIGYGSLNFTNPGNLAITPGSYRTLILSAPASTLGIWLNGGLRENTFAPVLGDPIQGFGQLQKNGAGKWILTSNQAYNGTTTVSDGVLQIGNGGTTGMVGSGVVTLQNNGDLVVKRSDAVVINNPINGNGTFATTDTEVVQVGTGTTTLGGAIDNSSLKVRVESGKLVLGKESTTAVHAAAIQVTVNGGILQLGGTGGDQIFDGASTGNAATTVYMNGGTFDTNGRSEGLSRFEGSGGVISNSASGTTSTLTVGTGNVSSFIGIGTTLQDGTGLLALGKTGTGTIAILGDNNTYTGGTTVNQGWLMLGNGGTTGSLPGTITVNQGGSLAVNRSNTYTLPNTVNGTGDLLQAGTGTTILNRPLSYQGATVVGVGQLQVDLSTSNNILPTVADLRLHGGGITFVGGSGGTSTQTVAGQFTVAGGDVRVNGTAGATALNLPAVWSRTTGGSVNFGTTGTAAINSAIANVGGIVGTPTAAYATYNGANWAAQSGNNSITAFSGYTPNSYAAGTHTDVTADFAFAGGATTDTIRFNAAAPVDLGLDGQILALNRGGVLISPTVAGNAVTISNGTLTGANASSSEVIVHQHNPTLPATISAVIANNGSNATALTKAGSGTLILAGANTYTGGTHVNQGILQIGNGSTAGTLGLGVVQNDATLLFNRSDAYTFTNPIAGFGTVIKSGSGVLNLRGNNSFTGGLTVSQGAVATDTPSGLGLRTVTLGDANTGANSVALFSDFGGDIPNNIVVSNLGSGTAILGSSSSGPAADPAIFSGSVVLNRAVSFQSGNTDRTTFTGVISGNPGTLTFATGRTTFEADNTFVATDLVVQGGATLQVGTGSVAFPRNQVPDNANVVLNGNGIFQLNGDSEIIGQLNSTSTTSLVQAAGSGPTVLTVANGGTFNGAFNGTANGGLTIESVGGTLTFGGTTDNNTGRVLVNGGTVVFAKTSTSAVHSAAIDVTVNSGVLRLGGTWRRSDLRWERHLPDAGGDARRYL
jgi:fibronectin-binding autotransporter adhesin